MGDYITDVPCPRCNSGDCEEWGRNNTREFLVVCSDCGYEYRFYWKRYGNGDFVLKDPKKGNCFENFIAEITELKDPYGCYILKNSQDTYSSRTLKNIEEYNEFQEYIKKELPKGNISELRISRFTEGRLIRKKLQHNLLPANEDLWDYCEEYRIPDPATCSYCEEDLLNWDICYDNMCPDCFEISSDQSEKECIEAEIEYQLVMNQLNNINKEKTN